MFQVHLMKKSKNWLCKLCGAKQSIAKIYLEVATTFFSVSENLRCFMHNKQFEIPN